jgi:subtilisin family serine protease
VNQQPKLWLDNLRHTLGAAFLGGIVGLAAVAPLAANKAVWPRDTGTAASFEEATPDCGPFIPDPFPARRRAQHLAQLGVDRWHAAGYRGRGMKIAVLDSGFRGYRAQLGKALPTRVQCRSFRRDGNLEAKDSQHGILCGEVLHALAPEADLLFANWEADRPDQCLEAARWARRQGAQILSCSVIMPSWSDGEGGGDFHRTLAEILGRGDKQGDVLCFASAGNTAQRHWCGAYHAGSDGCHEWLPGQTSNLLIPWGREPVSVELYGRQAGHFAIHVENGATGLEVPHRAGDREVSAQRVVVRFQPEAHTPYRLQVGHRGGPAEQFHLVVLGGGLSYATAAGSIACPADGAEVIAVGAVAADGQRFPYSSCGPNSQAPKPDLVAPVPFPSLWRARPFAGTSAAAPQAAGLAALCWSRHADWTANQVRAALRSSARDLGPPGHDCETGYGMIGLPLGNLARTPTAAPAVAVH